MSEAIRLRLDAGALPFGLRLPDGFAFRRFEPGDAAEVERLLIAARRDGLAGSPDGPVGWYGAVRSDPEWDPALVVLARETANGVLAGVAHSWTGGFLKDLAVREDRRRRGLAGALVAETASRFAVRGVAALDLKVRAGNAPARALYRSLGFREVVE